MLTVAEIAKEYNISVQTVYRAINAVKQGSTEQVIKKVKGIGYFTEFGEQAVREHLTPVKQDDKDGSTVLNDVKPPDDGEILYLREQNKALLQELEKEREHSRQQGERLADLADKIASLTHNTQVLLLQEQGKTTPPIIAGEREPEPPTVDIASSEQGKPGQPGHGESTPQETATPSAKPETQKAGLFSRLFGKKI